MGFTASKKEDRDHQETIGGICEPPKDSSCNPKAEASKRLFDRVVADKDAMHETHNLLHGNYARAPERHSGHVRLAASQSQRMHSKNVLPVVDSEFDGRDSVVQHLQPSPDHLIVKEVCNTPKCSNVTLMVFGQIM